MNANTRQLESIFDPNVFFQVPLFQRPYVWDEVENWDPLWEDIRALLDDRLRAGIAHSHFLGAIVLEQLPNPAGSIESRLVIDGQQRFTTLQLFLMAARNLAREHGANRFAARFSRLVENAEERIESPHEKFKLWPTNSDRAAFKAVHSCNSLLALEHLLLSKTDLRNSRIVEAYRYFDRHLAAWLQGELDEEDDKQALAGKTIDDRFTTLWEVVQGGLQLVVINLDKDDETQVIFETLNARGTELLPADLIKNYLFRQAASNGSDVETLYEEHWARFENDFWRGQVQQGRIKRPRIDLFINHYLTLMTRDEVKSTHLFNAFKHFVERATPSEGSPISTPTTPAAHIEQLARYADVFLKFYTPGTDTALALFLRRLEAVDTATIYPFLLHAFAVLMPNRQGEFEQVLAVLESFLMRRLIVNYTTKNYNRLFVDLIKAAERCGDVTAKVVADHLARGTGDSTKFPTDTDLQSALFNQPLYGRIAQYKVRAILEALDAVAYTSKSEALGLPSDLTIEHVLPQQWQTHWPLPDEVRADPVKEKEAVERRALMLNTLGNLTLITGSFNSSLQNAAWAAKRPELLTYSKLNLTQYFHGAAADTWDEAAIRARTEHLFRQLVHIWPDVERPAPPPA